MGEQSGMGVYWSRQLLQFVYSVAYLNTETQLQDPRLVQHNQSAKFAAHISQKEFSLFQVELTMNPRYCYVRQTDIAVV